MRKEFLLVIDDAFFEVRTIILDQGDNGPAVSRFFAGRNEPGDSPEWDNVS
jgi:hypothetical protein